MQDFALFHIFRRRYKASGSQYQGRSARDIPCSVKLIGEKYDGEK